MRVSSTALAAAVLAVAPTLMLHPPERAAAVDADPSANGSGYRVDPPFVRDADGRAVFFHGVNAVWKLSPYYPPSRLYGAPRNKSYFDARDARFLARNGLNSVRLGTLFVGVEPDHDVFDDSYLDRIESLVDMLGAEGVTVMIDFHQDMYNERYEGEGFPQWATIDDGVPFMSAGGFPNNYFTPAVMRAFDNLWMNRDGLWDEYRDAWEYVAGRFVSKPNLLGYDLFNEPWPGSRWETCANPQGCPEFETQYLQPFMEHMIAGIREADSENIVWWDPSVTTNYGPKNNVGLQTPIEDPAGNQGISFHIYCLTGNPSPGEDEGCKVTRPTAFASQQEAGARNDSALFLTEFGATDDLKDLRIVTRLADQNMVSWHYWHFGEWMDPTTTGTGGVQGLFKDDLERPGSLKQKKADVLIRTYPQAVAGAPKRFRFQPTSKNKRFTLVFKADPKIDAPTVIFVPVDRHYDGGYRVSVQGPAKVTSRRNTPLLTVKNTGEGKVVVKVTKA